MRTLANTVWPAERDNRRQLALRLLADEWTGLGWRYWAFAAGMVILGAVALLPPQFLWWFTEGAVLEGTASSDWVGRLLAFGLAIGAALWISSAVAGLLRERMRLRVEGDLRRRLLARIHEVPLHVLERRAGKEWVFSLTGSLAVAESFLVESVPEQLRQLGVLLCASVLLLVHGGLPALVPLVAGVLIVVGFAGVQRRLQPLREELKELHGGAFRFLERSLEGLRTVRSHGVEAHVQRRFEGKLGEVSLRGMTLVGRLGLWAGSQDFALQALVTLSLTAVTWALAKGSLTAADALAYPFFLLLFFGAAQGVAGAAPHWRRFVSEGSRLAEVLYGVNSFATSRELVRPDVSFKHARSLVVRGLSFGVGDQVLAGPVDFLLPRGELWAIMGPSGCGKSLFLEVLAGLRPGFGGAAIVIHRDGQGIWESAPGAETRLPVGPCAYVERHPYLFDGTLRENLTFANTDRLSDAVLWEFLERTRLYEFARERGGLDGHFRPAALGAGERFRIALCRALLLKRPFLLLDDPFATLDDHTINLVAATLDFQKRYSGIVVATHYLPPRLSVDGLVGFERAHRVSRSEKDRRAAGAGGFRPYVTGPEEPAALL